MEQELINTLVKFTAKAGAGLYIKELIQHVDENGNPKVWTLTEIEKAIRFLNHRIENFSKEDALQIVETLMYKFDIPQHQIDQQQQQPVPDPSGVKGLQ